MIPIVAFLSTIASIILLIVTLFVFLYIGIRRRTSYHDGAENLELLKSQSTYDLHSDIAVVEVPCLSDSFKYTALRGHIPDAPDDLLVLEGDVIVVHAVFSDGIALGTNSTLDMKGRFPLTCLQRIHLGIDLVSTVETMLRKISNQEERMVIALAPSSTILNLIKYELSENSRFRYFQWLLEREQQKNATSPRKTSPLELQKLLEHQDATLHGSQVLSQKRWHWILHQLQTRLEPEPSESKDTYTSLAVICSPPHAEQIF